ncbi:MAG TPA: ATP-binding protein [Gemmatimonadales bacterium]|nr:ATP-binding protein [Gemmatimonadales bacterium]
MKHSFRRTLALRFAGTMGLGLAALSAVYRSPLWAAHAFPAYVLIVLVATGATLVGAWLVAGSAVRPIREITEQAMRIEAGTLDQRIAAHADTDEFRDLVAVLNRMLERLDLAFRGQHRLVSDVSHELRTPLATLQGEIEVALRAPRSSREYELVLRSALEETGQLTTMAEDLLLITRAESHLLVAERVPTDPNAVVQTALAPLRRRIEEKGLVVDETLDPTALPVSLDPALVGRLVDHLLDNAVKYAPVGGRIGVRTEPTGPGAQGVRLVVENSGPGIAPADLPHVFEPFYRADQARTRGEGAGLGLALVAAIARLHGGVVRVSNKSSRGVRFEVDLPAFAPT